jgi:phage tail sheath protein FI
VPPRFGADAIALVHAAMVEQCERRRDRIALLDPPYDAVTPLTFAVSALREWRQRFDSAFATLYAPWLAVVDPLRAIPGRRSAGAALTRAIPPSGHVAGVIAASDLTRGVHTAPANVPLAWVQDATLPLDDVRHGRLNALGINAIRVQPGRGLRVLGARTLSSDTDWRFLNVRRLLCMIEKAIDLSIQWAVFEHNDWRTRAKLALVVGSFLSECWQRGAFIGATAQEAYYVRCDESNNPPAARARGELLMEVGVAPTVPFEFIVLRIGRDANGFAIRESDPVPAAA